MKPVNKAGENGCEEGYDQRQLRGRREWPADHSFHGRCTLQVNLVPDA
jgi:hypothetical protein